MQDYFENIIELIAESIEPIFPFIAVLMSLYLILVAFNSFYKVCFGDACFVSFKSSDKEDKPKKVRHKRRNEYGEYEYNYSQNNYECEGCK